MTFTFQITSFLLVVISHQLKQAFKPMSGWVFYTFLFGLALFLLVSPVVK